MVSLFFVVLVLACGAALTRALRLPLNIAPLAGLAAIAVLTTWCARLGAPPLVSSGLVVAAAIAGLLLSVRTAEVEKSAIARRMPLLVLAVSAAIPALMLGSAFAGIEAPVSTHDGAFHVEAIDSLRRGVPLETWYPVGFHASVAAVLGLMPWLDSARGTSEIGLGLAVLGPLAVFSLGLAFGLDALASAMAAAILAVTFIYPYDYHLWAGWPQGMGVLLVIGLLVSALRWTQRPTLGWALLGGLFAGAIVLSHGTEVYTSALALADRVLMQENAIYTVISPEGCAAILWRDAGEAKKAAAAFKPDAVHCLELGVIDGIVPEPEGGAHTNHDEAARLLGESLREALEDLESVSADDLKRRRRAKFRSLGVYA